MIFSYHSDGLELTGFDKKTIEEKLEKLGSLGARVDDESTKVHVEVVRGTRHNSPGMKIRCQLTIPGHSLRAESGGQTTGECIDGVEGKLRTQIEKLRG